MRGLAGRMFIGPQHVLQPAVPYMLGDQIENRGVTPRPKWSSARSATGQSISKHERYSTDAEKVAFVGRCGNHHLDWRQLGTLCHSGRSGSHANEIGANPGAPRGDIVPHCAGGRQMVLAGGQRDRAAACAPRGRSLVGLAAFPAILSVAARKHRAAHACLPPGVTLEPVPVKLRRRVPGGLAWPARSLFDWPDRVIEP